MADKVTAQEGDEPEENDDATPRVEHVAGEGDFVSLTEFFNKAKWLRVPQPGDEVRVTMKAVNPFTPQPDPPSSPEILYGAHIIREMTKVQMIEEMLYYQRLFFERQTSRELRYHVANARWMKHRERLIKEAGLDPSDLQG